MQNIEDAEKCLQAGTELKLHDNILDCHKALERDELSKNSNMKKGEIHKDSRNLYLVKEGGKYKELHINWLSLIYDYFSDIGW